MNYNQVGPGANQSPNVLYNLNFNQLDQENKQCSNILYEAESVIQQAPTNIKLENLDDMYENPESSKNRNKTNCGIKRQKKMKLTNR